MPPRLVVDARLLHYNHAGIGRYLLHLYSALASLPPDKSHGLDVTIVYSRKDQQRALQSYWPQTATAWTPPHNLLERWALAAELARLRPDLLHSPDHVTPQPFGWRAVLTVHDLAFRLMPQSHAPDSRAYYAGLERSARQAARIICVSDATRRTLVELLPSCAPRTRVVHEAPDPRYAASGPAHRQARPYVVFTGTVEPRKNVAGLVQALARIPPDRRPELHVIGAPGAAYADVLALISARGMEGDVTFLGRLPTEEVASRYRGALAMVFPSFLEGFGLPILEAMASGAPVVTSGRSSMAEVAGSAAALVDPHDPESIAEAIERIAGDAGYRQEMIHRGRTRAAQFTWTRAAAETLAVLNEVLT